MADDLRWTCPTCGRRWFTDAGLRRGCPSCETLTGGTPFLEIIDRASALQRGGMWVWEAVDCLPISVPLVSEAEDRIAALEKERHTARAALDHAKGTLAEAHDAREMASRLHKALWEVHELQCRMGAISQIYFELMMNIDISGALCPLFEADGLNVIWKDRDAILAIIAERNQAVANTIAAKDARIAELDSELAKRPAAVALSWAPAKEVRPHDSSPSGSLHLVAHLDGRFSVWTWFPADGHGGRWLWVDPATPSPDMLDGYSGLEGFGTGPQDAWSEGWRYCRPATPAAFVDSDAPKVEHNPFRAFPRDMRRMGP